jgi:hypothetical protein
VAERGRRLDSPASNDALATEEATAVYLACHFFEELQMMLDGLLETNYTEEEECIDV